MNEDGKTSFFPPECDSDRGQDSIFSHSSIRSRRDATESSFEEPPPSTTNSTDQIKELQAKIAELNEAIEALESSCGANEVEEGEGLVCVDSGGTVREEGERWKVQGGKKCAECVCKVGG